MKKVDKYKQDGVNIEEGDDFSAYAGKICQSTYHNSPHVRILDMSAGNFRGPRGYELTKLPKGCVQTIAPDGIGTKVVLIDAVQTYENAARDVFAMTVHDISRWGGLALVFSNVIDFNTIGEKGDPTNKAARAVLWGVKEAARETKTVFLNGETAELGMCVFSENPTATLKFNWAGFMVGVYHPKKMILGNTLEPGQIIMALKENGFRSNGISSVRKALKIRYGECWWANPRAEKDIRAAAEPSVLYSHFLSVLHGWHTPQFKPSIKMHLIVHLSGGAFESKLAKDILFPQGFSAVIDDLFEPPEIMSKCAKWRGMSEEECYKTWNGGQGMIVVINAEDKQPFTELASIFNITAQKCGEIKHSRRSGPKVVIESKFGQGETIIFRPKS